MKICPYCGNQNSDDSLFCSGCGKTIPRGRECPYCATGIINDEMFCRNCGRKISELPAPDTSKLLQKKCPHCGANINSDDVFCQICGKKIINRVVPSSSEQPHNADTSQDDLESQVNDIDKTEECNTRTWRDNLFYIFGTVVIVCVLGACLWNYYFSSQRAERNIALADSLEEVRKDSIAHVRKMEKAIQDSIYKAQQEEKVFLEEFYRGLDNCSNEELLAYVQENVTQRAFTYLKEECPYADDGDDCYATWMFTYEDGCDYDKFLSRRIEQVSDNTFLVTNIWGYEDDGSYKTDYKVRLGIVKDGNSYKIDTIINASEEERAREAKAREAKEKEAKEKEVRENRKGNSKKTITQEDFRIEVMKRTQKIAEIMGKINSIHNGYLMSRGANEITGIHAISKISDLQIEGDDYFREIISLARKAGRQDLIQPIQQEKKDFDAKSYQMQNNIRRFYRSNNF